MPNQDPLVPRPAEGPSSDTEELRYPALETVQGPVEELPMTLFGPLISDGAREMKLLPVKERHVEIDLFDMLSKGSSDPQATILDMIHDEHIAAGTGGYELTANIKGVEYKCDLPLPTPLIPAAVEQMMRSVGVDPEGAFPCRKDSAVAYSGATYRFQVEFLRNEHGHGVSLTITETVEDQIEGRSKEKDADSE